MEHIEVFGNRRTLAFCTFCGGETATGDHCPSRVLLDDPYPEHLPKVPACERCNHSFSLDEEYLACLLSCVLAGSTDPAKIRRNKVRRILEKKPALVARIEAACIRDGENVAFSVEDTRIYRVITKLAQGHAMYELHEHCISKPSFIMIQPLSVMSDKERANFETPTPPLIWPEIGSRAMQRLIVTGDSVVHDWLVVQPGMYRYLAEAGADISVRIVVHEYLACHLRW